jgi:hypothetical protein
MRRRVYMSEDADLIRWLDKLEQPNVHYLYRSFFNAVDVHNKLAVGPRSVSGLCVGSLPLKLWLSIKLHRDQMSNRRLPTKVLGRQTTILTCTRQPYPSSHSAS